MLILLITALLTGCAHNSYLVQQTFYPEGPLVIEDILYFVEYSTGKVIKKDMNSLEESVFWKSKNCGPAGLHREGRFLYVSCYDSNDLARIDMRNQKTIRIKLGFGQKGPNDFTSVNESHFLFSNSGLFDISSPVEGNVSIFNGKSSKTLAKKIHYSNGLSLVGDKLFVSEHFKNRILIFKFQNNKLSDRKVWVELPRVNDDPYLGPDGMTYSPKRNSLFVAQYSGGKVYEISLEGNILKTINIGLKYPTNIEIYKNKLIVTAVKDANNSPYPGSVVLIDL